MIKHNPAFWAMLILANQANYQNDIGMAIYWLVLATVLFAYELYNSTK